jgi:hypothetical protein
MSFMSLYIPIVLFPRFPPRPGTRWVVPEGAEKRNSGNPKNLWHGNNRFFSGGTWEEIAGNEHRSCVGHRKEDRHEDYAVSRYRAPLKTVLPSRSKRPHVNARQVSRALLYSTPN